MIDGKFVKADKIIDDNIKIALYHGPISNSKNSKGFEFSQRSITNFDGYNFVLLGDIHYHQYLNDEKTIAYASSLISQNFGETDENHGVLVWDLLTKKSEYKIIENEYRYCEVEIIDDTLVYNKKKINPKKLVLPKYCKLRINSIDFNKDKYNEIVQLIKDNNQYISIVHNKLLMNKEINNIENEYNVNNTFMNIIKNEVNNVDVKYKDSVEKILLNDLKDAVQTIDSKLNWKLLSLEFSNMFSYGSNNKIDFTKLTFDEIIGLFGPNSVGKSSLIDILLFSLFDDYSRNCQDNLSGTLINNKESKFFCKVQFFINNNIYEIIKTGYRLKAKSINGFDTFKFIDYHFYKIDDNKNICLSGVDRYETLKKIIKLIGTYDDFCITSLCSQNNQKINNDFPKIAK